METVITETVKNLVDHIDDQMFAMLEREKRKLGFKKAKELPNFIIAHSTLFDPILHITAHRPDNNGHTHQSFLINYSQQNIAYATLLAESPLSALFGNQIAREYKVLRAAQNGATQQVRRLMQDGANGWHKDKQRAHTIFNLINREGNLCTKTDIEAGNVVRFILSSRPLICAFPYSNSKSTLPFILSGIHSNLQTAKAIIDESQINTSQKEEALCAILEAQSIIDDEQQTLQIAQKERSVPVLSIDADCDTMPRPRYLISSNFNRGMKIQYHIDADQCCIGAKTDRSTWKYPHPDLKILAIFYAELIAKNKNEGKKIIDAFDSWNKIFPGLRRHITGNLLSILEAEKFDDQHLLLTNLTSLAQQYIPHLPQLNSMHSEYKLSTINDLNELRIKRLLGEVLSLSTGRAYDASGNLIDATSKKTLDAYMKQLNANPNSKQLFRLVCDANPHLTNVLKSAWQQIVLREFLIRTLSGNSDLQEKEGNIVNHIVSFWEPDTEFKKGL
jgi:hypothetical protein